jgi:inner membrane protein
MRMRTSALARLAVMGALLLALMFPLWMVEGVVSERAQRRDEAVKDVSEHWGGAQTIGGPVLSVPYETKWTDATGIERRAEGRAFFLPSRLDIRGTVAPQVRSRGLFEAVVYTTHLTVTGQFARPDWSAIRPVPDRILWEQATLAIGVSDPRGITRRVTMTGNGVEEPCAPGVGAVGYFSSGVHAPLHGYSASSPTVTFSLTLDVNGARELRFVPAGDDTSVHLESEWPHPSFSGAPLPETRQVGSTGFSADWRVPYFARGYSQSWSLNDVNFERMRAQADASAFGVALIRPVDIYQQAERAVKYAALFIVMTFVIAFLWEVGRGALLHPVQYLFLGFAMCVFYLLLVSFSERIGFDVAYLTAAVATIALLAWYWSRIVTGRWQGPLMALVLTAVYSYLYLLLRLEDYALLAGSVGLFIMLALVMFFTRRVNWYDLRLGSRVD